MGYIMRPMQVEDIPQVTEIDHEAFSTQWSSSAYMHELHNRMAYQHQRSAKCVSPTRNRGKVAHHSDREGIGTQGPLCHPGGSPLK